MVAAGNPNISATVLCISHPCSPNAAVVPTAPSIIPMQTLDLAFSNLTYCLWSSSAQIPNFIPYVVGSACCPCVRPIHTFILFSSVNLSIILVNLSNFSSKTSIESRMSNEFELSTISLDVAPK